MLNINFIIDVSVGLLFFAFFIYFLISYKFFIVILASISLLVTLFYYFKYLSFKKEQFKN